MTRSPAASHSRRRFLQLAAAGGLGGLLLACGGGGDEGDPAGAVPEASLGAGRDASSDSGRDGDADRHADAHRLTHTARRDGNSDARSGHSVRFVTAVFRSSPWPSRWFAGRLASSGRAPPAGGKSERGRRSRSARGASPPCTSMCAALFCCPFSGGALIPLLRSPSSASDGPIWGSGGHGSQ